MPATEAALAPAAQHARVPTRLLMSRPLFALSIAFAIGIAIGAITKD
ncbi:MAG: hypothetical protein JNJ73_07210 [Hyphomonadaceae bacterium]|nr:hypothetical protein [Hyphomonadaceae bacterium]